MAKKKKSASATAAAATAAASSADGSAAAPTATATATAGASAKAAPAAAAPQPWASNYEAMRVWPIVADPSLFLATDSLAEKVNRSAATVTATAAPAAAGGASASASSSSSSSSASASRFQFSIFDSRADDSGRRAIARHPIAAGTLLLRERGQPWITHAEHMDKVCHACAACIYDPTIDAVAAATAPAPAADAPKPPSRHLHCDECDAAFYCSAACQTAHLPVHSLECPALQQCEDISELAKCNVDLIRAAIRYAVAKGLEKEKDAGDKDNAATSTGAAAAAASFDPYHFQSTPSDSELLMDHIESVAPSDLRNMRDAASLVLKALPPSCALPVDRVVAFMGRLNSNCHALHLEAHPTIQFGFGLYPLCAIFNHSCYPSCIFVNEGADLTFRVIRDVEAGEELTVNYVSLYAPRTMRRKELWQTKKFFCQCRRCMLRPKNEEERQKFAFDAAIGGISCQAPAASASGASASGKKDAGAGAAGGKCPGSYRINYQMLDPKVEAARKAKRREEKKKKLAEAAAAAAGGDAAASAPVAAAPAAAAAAAAEDDDGVVEIDTSRPNESHEQPKKTVAAEVAPTAGADSDSDDDDSDDDSPDEFPLSLRPKVTSCRCNVCGHTGNKDALHAIQLRAIDESERLLAVYGSGTRTPQQVKDEFEPFLREMTGVLHPSHAVLFNLLLPLVNVTSALREWKLKTEFCKKVVEMAEKCFPPHFLPTCNYYETLGNAHLALLKQGVNEGVPKKLVMRHRDDAVAVFEKLAASLRICRGADHPLTQAALRKIQETKKHKLAA